MFRKTSTQLTFFEPEIMVPGILPADDWSYIFREKIYPLIDEDEFKNLYQETGGAPNKSVKIQVSLLIFMHMEKLTWREAESQFQRRIDWLNATGTSFGEGNIDHTTLFKFYQKLQNKDTAYELFKKLTSTFLEERGVSLAKQRVDSFFMGGWLERLSRYGLLKETIRVFLQNLRKQKPGCYDNIEGELSQNYLDKNFDLTEKDKERANRKIRKMAGDMHAIKLAFENHKQIQYYQSFETLLTVFEQQCLVVENKEAGQIEVEIRDVPVGEKIISTPHNTDAEYTRKRNQKIVGHKGFATETCAPENSVQFITDVNLETARHSDAAEIFKIEERLIENEMTPEKLYGDAGFVNGKSILSSAKNDIKLEGPSSGRSQSFEQYDKADRPLDIADFKVIVNENTKELKVIACPNKLSPMDQSRSPKTGKILVHFKSKKCGECKFKERCPVKIGKKKATLTVNEEQYAGAARHHKYMGDSEYRKECGIRAGAESLMNELANGHGARKSRHRSEKGARLQLLFAAMACNVKRYLRATAECFQNPVETLETGV